MGAVAERYRERAPLPVLGGFVRCVWTGVVPPAGERAGSVLPDGCSDIVWTAGRSPWVAVAIGLLLAVRFGAVPRFARNGLAVSSLLLLSSAYAPPKLPLARPGTAESRLI